MTKLKLATALGVAGAIALSIPSAEARDGRNAALGFGLAAGALALGAAAASASHPYYHGGYYGGPYTSYRYGGPYASFGGTYAYSPSVYDSYAYWPDRYYGRSKMDRKPKANYDPNASGP